MVLLMYCNDISNNDNNNNNNNNNNNDDDDGFCSAVPSIHSI